MGNHISSLAKTFAMLGRGSPPCMRLGTKVEARSFIGWLLDFLSESGVSLELHRVKKGFANETWVTLLRILRIHVQASLCVPNIATVTLTLGWLAILFNRKYLLKLRVFLFARCLF